MKCVSAPLPSYLLKGVPKRDFLYVYLSTSFGVRKLKNTSAVRVIFIFKLFKIKSKFRKTKKKKRKNSKNVFCFCDNCIRKCCNNLPLLRGEYLSSTVKGLNKCPRILHITKRDFFLLNSLQKVQQIWQRCCGSDFSSVSASLPCHF